MTKRKKGKRTNNDPQNTTQKTKDRATRTLLKNVEQTLLIHHRGTKQHQWCNGKYSLDHGLEVGSNKHTYICINASPKKIQQ
jgi:hypothetical protein